MTFRSLLKRSQESAGEPKASTPKILKTRKRALTLPLPPDSEKKQAAFNQDHSLLFSRLPAEIRSQIWREYYSGMVFKLTVHNYFLEPWGQFAGTPGYRLLSLLLCCRRTYV